MLVRQLDHSLSVEYLFFKSSVYMVGSDVSGGLTFSAIALALEKHGQPAENEWPYQQKHPAPWIAPTITQTWHGKLEVTEGSDRAAVTSASAMHPPFVLAVKLTAEFIAVSGPLFIIPAEGKGFGAHAVLVIGIAEDELGVKHFLIRNSWGDKWGEGGCAWLPIAYLADKLIGVCAVTQIP